uniref:Nicotinamide-nucleotide adenylyltransferase n=1 Tax=Timspurckia oligopyrenoides TaxID=708627 RepID=A0A7S0ZBL5_9RHOD|mmetsp:Transcript_11423/g.20662  ORF Transcript_11423/g.20662 Transcript_11423/m.20662 type:complete len:220 (+) Transcript_11423:33-692(+)
MKSKDFCVLVSCGSFSPITYAHLLLLETAKNFISSELKLSVLKGVISPVNDAYPKRGLVSSKDRIEMCKLAINDSTWIEVDTWEAEQSEYIRSYKVLQHIKQSIPETIQNETQMMFVCGTDFVHGMSNTNLWPTESVKRLLQETKLLVQYRPNAHSLDLDWLEPQLRNRIIELPSTSPYSSISSTLVRDLIASNLSVKYMIPSQVIDYIVKQNLFVNSA